jgi:hypothetical protein
MPAAAPAAADAGHQAGHEAEHDAGQFLVGGQDRGPAAAGFLAGLRPGGERRGATGLSPARFDALPSGAWHRR